MRAYVAVFDSQEVRSISIIGIDLGTSNSAAAVLRGGRLVIIPSAEGVSLGGKAFPSYVAMTPDGQILIGEPARRQAAANPEGTATAFKRKMGRREVIRLRDREFSPEQLSAFLLQKIKRDAEAFLGEPVTQAVVTVPAYFDDNQRSATTVGQPPPCPAQRLASPPCDASAGF
jgi:molecular chaperone DnaK